MNNPKHLAGLRRSPEARNEQPSASQEDASAQDAWEDKILPALDPEGAKIDPYEVLKIGPDAKPMQIRTAYLMLAKQYHPDVNPDDPDAERRFKGLNDAYRLAAAASRMQQRRAPPSQTKLWASAVALFLFGLFSTLSVRQWLDDRPRTIAVTQKTLTPVTAIQPDNDATHRKQLADEPAMATDNREAFAGPAKPLAVAAAVNKDLADVKSGAERDETASIDSADGSSDPILRNEPPALMETSAAVTVTPQPEQSRVAGQAAAPENSQKGRRRDAMSGELALATAETEAEPWKEEWRTLQNSADLHALQGFIERYPDKRETEDARKAFQEAIARSNDVEELRGRGRAFGSDSPEAKWINQRLAELVEHARLMADIEAWLTVRKTQSIAAAKAYLKSYPAGRYSQNAYELIAALESEMAEKKDDAAWRLAKRKGTGEALQVYLRAYPDGQHAHTAQKMIKGIDRRTALAAFENSGGGVAEAIARAEPPSFQPRRRAEQWSYFDEQLAPGN